MDIEQMTLREVSEYQTQMHQATERGEQWQADA